MQKELYVIAHNIRSAHNVGAIFRTSDGAGVKKIFLTGYTPEPVLEEKKEKSKAEKMLEKTALGAEKSVPWERAENLNELLKKLKKKKIQIVALEKTADSELIFESEKKFPLALILGNEVTGVEENILAECDRCLAIPMRGVKESLNVSVAAGIAIYEILK